MDFYEVLDQVAALLQKRKRVIYGALKLQFKLDDEQLQILKEELIEAQRVAVDEDGKVLVWVGSLESSVQSLESQTANLPDARRQTLDPRPISYTPAHLAERIRAEQAALEARGAADGERKTITALFADLKGSTALIEGLDPEEARAIIDPALQLMMDAVHGYDGYVAQALGDGIFALFGAPIAHEDHPQRALYAALRMQEAMRRYADTLRAKGYPPLLMRVGLNTGEVVVRSIRKDDLHTDYVPVGHSTNLAARMEQLANPGSIVISAYTHRLTDGYFAFEDLGPTQIKGVEEPLNIYEVLSVGPLRTRLQVAALRGLTRFVGRQSEMEQLQLAQELAHPLSFVDALLYAAMLHVERGDGHVAQERADAMVALASEHGFPDYMAVGTVFRGAALIVQEQWAEGIAQVRQGLEAFAGELERTLYLAWLARGYGGAGQVEDGLAAVAEALRLVDKTDERFDEAELYRLRGEFTLAQSSVQRLESSVTSPQHLTPSIQAEADAEACFLKAIEVARQQRAKSLELRVVMSLSRLWQQQGKKEEARKLLAEIYSWFTEGFDTRDLQEAKALLEQLS